MIQKIKNKYLVPFLLIVSSLFFVASVVFAATPAIEPMSKVVEQNPLLIIGMFFMGFCNLGSMVYLAKRYMSKVDKDSDLLVRLVTTAEQLQECTEKLVKSNDVVREQVTVINTIHKIKGCDQATRE